MTGAAFGESFRILLCHSPPGLGRGRQARVGPARCLHRGRDHAAMRPEPVPYQGGRDEERE